MLELNIQRFAADGAIQIRTLIDTKEFDAQMDYIEARMLEIEELLEKADMGYEVGDVLKLEKEYEQLGNRLLGLRTQQEKYNQALKDAEKSGFDRIKEAVENTGKSVENVTRKVIKWGLAVFGIRSAYTAIRRVISMVAGSNEEISNSMQQMRNVLASALLPIAQSVVNVLAKVMVYINYIFKMLTGRNLFDFSKATKDVEDNLKGGAGAAKEIRKQLAGFDEMNILGDNVAAAGGGAGAVASEFGNIFDKLKDIKIPKWIKDLANALKELKKYWKEIITVVAAFGTALATLKVINLVKDLLNLQNITPQISGGFALITSGVVLLAGSIINLILNWDNMTTKEKVITGFLAVVGAAFIALGYSISTGISAATLGIGALIAAIVALVAAMGTQIWKEYESIAAIKDEAKQQDELTNAKKRAKDADNDLILAIERQEEAQRNLTETEQKNQMSGESLYKSVQDGTLTYKEMTKQQRETYKAYLELENANENLKNATEEKIKADSANVASEYNVQIANDKTGRSYNELRDNIIEAWEKGEISTEDAQESISRMMTDMDLETSRRFRENIPESINKGLDAGQYRSTLDKLGDIIRWKFEEIARNVNNLLHFELFVGLSGGGGSGRGFAKGGMIYHKLPKLAPGGIINQPGRGVPLGSAIGGERGAEGVIPLTDSQQMALLGEAIGKYITINANITNTMNGRVISKELQKIQAEDDFAFNR